jgi:uncharacterized membrane protein
VSTLSTPLRVLLLGSLCLNLLLISAVGGLLWRERAPAPTESAEARSLPDPRRIARALPPERRALVRQALAPERAAFVAELRALREAHSEVRRALRAQPYEDAALVAAFAEVRERERAMAERVHAGLVRLAAELSPEERAQLADSVPQRGRGRGHREHDSPAKEP